MQEITRLGCSIILLLYEKLPETHEVQNDIHETLNKFPIGVFDNFILHLSVLFLKPLFRDTDVQLTKKIEGSFWLQEMLYNKKLLIFEITFFKLTIIQQKSQLHSNGKQMPDFFDMC